MSVLHKNESGMNFRKTKDRLPDNCENVYTNVTNDSNAITLQIKEQKTFSLLPTGSNGKKVY